MARRRRSLIGGSKPRSTTQDSAPEVDEEVSEEVAEEVVDVDEEAELPTAAPEAFIPDAVDTEAVTADEAPLDLDEDEGELAFTHDPSGGYEDAETQMDEYSGSDAFADPSQAEFGDTNFGTPLSRDEPEARLTGEAVDPTYEEDLQVEGLLDDDPDLYGDFGGLENPPTEEVALYQDVGQPHNAPMHVPEPPPIPGIEDRFTPPPVERTDLGSRHRDSRPSYLAPTPPPVERGAVPDEGFFSNKSMKKEVEVDEEEVESERKSQMFMVAVAAMVVLGVVVIGFGMVIFGVGGEEVTVVEVPTDHRGVAVKKGIQKEGPELLGDLDGVDDPARLAAAEEEARLKAEEEAAQAAEEGTEAPAEPAPTEEVAPAPAPAPVVAPAPPPAPRRQPKAEPAATTAKLEIRANRKVLVYVDGKAVGYTPVDYDVGSGSHEVVALVSGRPETRQTQQIQVIKLGEAASVKFTF